VCGSAQDFLDAADFQCQTLATLPPVFSSLLFGCMVLESRMRFLKSEPVRAICQSHRVRSRFAVLSHGIATQEDPNEGDDFTLA
jgi:hypothetical protein